MWVSHQRIYFCILLAVALCKPLHQLGLFISGCILMKYALGASHVYLLDSSLYSLVFVVGVLCNSSVSLLYSSSEVRLYHLVPESFLLNDNSSFLCGFNIRHALHLPLNINFPLILNAICILRGKCNNTKTSIKFYHTTSFKILQVFFAKISNKLNARNCVISTKNLKRSLRSCRYAPT